MEKDFDRGELIRQALEQQKEAYAPYSGFCVAAAVLTGSGTIYTGVNVENAAFSAGIKKRRTPRSMAEITMGSAPRTGRTPPFRDSSPNNCR